MVQGLRLEKFKVQSLNGSKFKWVQGFSTKLFGYNY